MESVVASGMLKRLRQNKYGDVFDAVGNMGSIDRYHKGGGHG